MADLLDRDVARYAELERVDRAEAAEDQAAAEPAAVAVADPPSPPPTRAAEFTPDAAAHLSDDDLIDAMATLPPDDWAAMEQIVSTLDQRAEQAADVPAGPIVYTGRTVVPPSDPSPLTNPAKRPERKRTREQECREEYDADLYVRYMQAENDCRGFLLNREGREKGVDPATLFEGPAARARKYASEELRQWWARNGRITFAEWKFQAMGRQSDRKAARTASAQSLGESAA